MNKKEEKNRVGGISANRLVIPVVVILAVLHLMILSVIFMINTSSSRLSRFTQDAGRNTEEATSILAGSSLLSETSSHFILMPLNETGEINVAPLQAYAFELSQPRRGSQVLEKFRTYDVREEELALIEEAANSADFMLEAQIHALSLMRDVYPLPEIPPLTSIPLAELTEEEQKMSDVQKEAAARTLVLGSVYGLNKQTVSASVNACVEMMKSDTSRVVAETSRKIAIMRKLLWTITIMIIVILIAAFAALYRQILAPLSRFVKQIPEDVSLQEDRGFKEVRMVAAAYNDVLKRRNALDNILRSAAETDALTNLPNRYRFEQYLLESGERGYSMALLLFDVNYLKRTNDTEGHLAGDKLIRTAADCISSCFGEYCFRFGGDEFAAIVKDCTPEKIDQMVARFEETEKAKNVSISLGYAYAREVGDTTFRQMMDEADKKMYEMKRQNHMNERQ